MNKLKIKTKLYFLRTFFVLMLSVISLFVFRDNLSWVIWKNLHCDSISVVLNQDDAKLFFDIGNYYFGGGAYDLGKSEEYYKKALSLNDSLKSLHYQMARLYFIKNELSRARYEINKEIEEVENETAETINETIEEIVNETGTANQTENETNEIIKNETKEIANETIKEAENDVCNLSRHMPSGPFPQAEVRRRETILLRQLTLYKIEDARKHDKKDSELLNTAIYDLMTDVLKAYQ